MAWLTAGVGVYRSAESIMATTSLAASTSSADTHAGSESPCVSRPMNNGPVVPCARAVLDDGLGDREDVGLVERCR